MLLASSIPILMYHHVNGFPEDSITISPENFETQIRYLKGAGYTSITLPEIFGIMYGKAAAPKNSVLITFDDGYADNFINALPILKKYGMKATIFVTTSLIKDSRSSPAPIRPHKDIVRGSILAKDGLDDYLTWQEMKRMEDGGIIDIQSHSQTHRAYFSDDKILSFNDGRSTKLFSATDGDARLGIPVYKMAPALAARRYFDDRALRDVLAEYASKHGVSEKLASLVKDYIREVGGLKGRFETKEEQHARILNELLSSKQVIEKKLNKKCGYICWPWGSVDKNAVKIAREVGYVGGVGMRGGANMALTNPFDIHRFNPCGRDIPSLKQALAKYSSLFLSAYNNDKIDALFIPKKRFI